MWLLVILVSAELCEQIAKIRRKVQRLDKRKVLFIDETHKRLSDAATDTVVLPVNQLSSRWLRPPPMQLASTWSPAAPAMKCFLPSSMNPARDRRASTSRCCIPTFATCLLSLLEPSIAILLFWSWIVQRFTMQRRWSKNFRTGVARRCKRSSACQHQLPNVWAHSTMPSLMCGEPECSPVSNWPSETSRQEWVMLGIQSNSKTSNHSTTIVASSVAWTHTSIAHALPFTSTRDESTHVQKFVSNISLLLILLKSHSMNIHHTFQCIISLQSTWCLHVLLKVWCWFNVYPLSMWEETKSGLCFHSNSYNMNSNLKSYIHMISHTPPLW